jgi:hypothetical protein
MKKRQIVGDKYVKATADFPECCETYAFVSSSSECDK